MTRRVLFFLAWPVRAVLALVGLFLGACICPDGVAWELCKRDVRDLLRAWPERPTHEEFPGGDSCGDDALRAGEWKVRRG